ncbi:hypothetical protein EVAR_30820_1 [Eumeta japonica]|uniref:Uncharacterized protein n=1 Tax=Eumeta variegata TaxID=151549 RepID=A0A4C1SGN2_EUMVA|nr:hypothetical protein EVAR_30820_1 [Eumeta japonica]
MGQVTPDFCRMRKLDDFDALLPRSEKHNISSHRHGNPAFSLRRGVLPETGWEVSRVNWIVGVATLAVVTGRHAILSTIEPSEKGVAKSLAHGDASPQRTHYYL